MSAPAFAQVPPATETSPAIEEIVKTCPARRARMTGNAARVTFIAPKTFVSNCRRTCSSEVFSNQPRRIFRDAREQRGKVS